MALKRADQVACARVHADCLVRRARGESSVRQRRGGRKNSQSANVVRGLRADVGGRKSLRSRRRRRRHRPCVRLRGERCQRTAAPEPESSHTGRLRVARCPLPDGHETVVTACNDRVGIQSNDALDLRVDGENFEHMRSGFAARATAQRRPGGTWWAAPRRFPWKLVRPATPCAPSGSQAPPELARIRQRAQTPFPSGAWHPSLLPTRRTRRTKKSRRLLLPWVPPARWAAQVCEPPSPTAASHCAERQS